MKHQVYTMKDLAQVLCLNVNALYRKMPDLYEKGFPRPLPMLGLRFSVQQVHAWLHDYPTILEEKTQMPRFISAHKRFLTQQLLEH